MSQYRVLIFEDSWDDEPLQSVLLASRPHVGDQIQFDPRQNYNQIATPAFEIMAVRHIVAYGLTGQLAVMVRRMP